MPVIHIKNGTTSVTIECGPFATLMYDNEDDAYNCIYSDWEYGVLAIIAFMGILIPIALIIYCCVKCHNRVKMRHIYPSYSRQSSQSSLYPSSGRDLPSSDNPDVDYIQSARRRNKKDKKYQKLYYPYAAYGTYDRSSLVPSVGDSAASLARHPPEVAVANPRRIPEIPRSNADAAVNMHLSNSAPVIDSKLRDYRESLRSANPRKNIPGMNQFRSVKSVDSIVSHSSNSLLNSIHEITAQTEKSLKSRPSRRSFTASSITSSSDGSLLYPEEKNEYSGPQKKNSGPQNKIVDNTMLQNPDLQKSDNNPSINNKIKTDHIIGGENSSFTAVPRKKSNLSVKNEPSENKKTDVIEENKPSEKTADNESNPENIISTEIFPSISNSETLKDAAMNIPINIEKIDNTRVPLERASSFDSVSSRRSGLSESEKNRILGATPTKHMKTRQDFDDFLVESVLKLPEDQRNGTFLIRDSNSVDNCKVLTLYYKSSDNNGTLFYYKILTTEDGVHFEDELKLYPTLDDLISVHKSEVLTLPCLLGDCMGKNF